MSDDRFKIDLKAVLDTQGIKEQLKKVSETTKIKIDANDAPKTEKIITKFTTSTGKACVKVQDFNKEGKLLNTTFTTTATSAKTLGDRMTEAGRKLQSVNGIFQALKNAAVTFEQTIQPLLEFDEALTEFKKVSDLSGEALDEYTKKLGSLGAEVSRTRAEMTQSASEFKRSGYSEDDSAILAKVAALFQNVADSEVDAGDAASFIVSQLKAFGFAAGEAEGVIDSINEVANNFSVSSTDISQGLSKTSAAMSVLGNDFYQTIGLLTAGTEILSGQASKVARGLRTIGNNFASVAKESDSFTVKVQGTTKTISLIDKETGDLASTFKIFDDLSEYWNDMTNAEKQSVAIAYAGKHQFEVFTSVMENFKKATQATKTAMNAQGSAQQENSRYMESFQAKINSVKASWDELVIAFTDSDAIKDILDSVNTALRSLAENDEAIEKIIQLVKIVAILKGVSLGADFLKGFTVNIGNASTKAKDLIAVLKSFRSESIILTETQASLAASLAKFGTGLVTIAPYAAAAAIAIGTLGIATGKFGEMYNKYIANTSDDVNKVADAYLKLVKATEYDKSTKRQRSITLSGQDAVESLIKKLEKLNEQYNSNELSAQQFLDKVGDVSALQDYYNSLQNIIDSGKTLTKKQQTNYVALSNIFSAYNDAEKAVEKYDTALKIHNQNTNLSTDIIYKFVDSLVEVGGKYQFVSEEAKKAAISQLETEKSLTQQTLAQINARMAARLSEYGSLAEFSASKLQHASPTGAGQYMQTDEGQLVQKYYKIQSAISELKKIKVSGGGISGGGTSTKTTRGSSKSGSGSSSTKKEKKTEKKDYLTGYKKELEEYQEYQEELYQKGIITASEYYSRIQKKGYSYYKKLKSMGKDYADDAKSMLEDYKNINSKTVDSVFDEIEYRYKEGQISGQKYYSELWKYAKKFYKNGKINFEEYRDYVKNGYEAMFDDIAKQYEKGEITAKQYQKKVKQAEEKATSSITKASKSGTISSSTAKATRNTLIEASASAMNKVAEALKEAAIKAAEAAVDAAEKKLDEAQKRKDKSESVMSALQFWADEQTEIIDKTIDGYNEQIDKLNEQLDLLDKQNDALDKQAERVKLVNELEDAKKQKTVRVYDSRLGWVKLCPFIWRHILKQMGISVKEWGHLRPRKDLVIIRK